MRTYLRCGMPCPGSGESAGMARRQFHHAGTREKLLGSRGVVERSGREHNVEAAAILRNRLINRPGIPADTIAFGDSVVSEDVHFIGGLVS